MKKKIIKKTIIKRFISFIGKLYPISQIRRKYGVKNG